MQHRLCSLIILLRSARNIKRKVPIGQQNQPPKDNLVHLLPNAELLNGEAFYTLKEAQVLIESWRCHYNAIRPHGSLGYRPLALDTVVLPIWPPGSATLRRPPSLAEKPSMH